MTGSADPFELLGPALARAGGKSWFVGGALRDRLNGRTVTDVDIAAEGDSRHVARAVHDALGGDIFSLSDQFGTWRVLTPLGFQVDVSQLRGGSIESDLAERDFTVNAIAEAATGGGPIDPFGGQSDLAARRLKAVSDRVFTDDPLRLLRLARLSTTLELEVEPETEAAARAHAALADQPSAERIFDELRALVGSQAPLAGIERLSSLGLLEVVLPELAALQGIEQTKYHHKDVYGHTLEVLERTIELETSGYEFFGESAPALKELMAEDFADGLSRAGALRWAALLHDIAKPETRVVHEGGRTGFPGHDKLGAQVVREICRRLHTSERFANFISALTREHMRLGFLVRQQPISRRELYRYLTACEPVEVEVCVLSVADRLSTRGHKHEQSIPPHIELALKFTAEAIEHRRNPLVPLLRGDELAAALGIEPGPKLGELLAEIAAAQFAGEITDGAEAIELARAAL
jgi:putative nucleotidyltransferase with HDIG domain